jgi:hypothetical protein
VLKYSQITSKSGQKVPFWEAAIMLAPGASIIAPKQDLYHTQFSPSFSILCFLFTVYCFLFPAEVVYLLLSGEWGEMMKKKKKVSFELSDESSDDLNGSGGKQGQSKETAIVKSEMQSLKEALEDVKIQLAASKKNRKPIPVSRSNIWCTQCKKEGHYSHGTTSRTQWGSPSMTIRTIKK